MTLLVEHIAKSLDDLPFEEEDITATEDHARTVELIKTGLEWRLADRAVAIDEIFLVARFGPGWRQVSPDVLVRFGAHAGSRRRFEVDEEGVPDVTIEVLSTANRTTEGMIKLQEKRNLLGAIGVSEHIEIDPESGTIQVWSSTSGLLRSDHVGKAWHSDRLGVTFRFEDLQFVAVDDAGRVFEQPAKGFARAEAAEQRAAEAEDRAAEAEDRAAEAEDRAARYRALLEQHGIVPEG